LTTFSFKAYARFKAGISKKIRKKDLELNMQKLIIDKNTLFQREKKLLSKSISSHFISFKEEIFPFTSAKLTS